MKKFLMLTLGFAIISAQIGLFAEDVSKEKSESKKPMTMEQFVDEFNKGLSTNKELFDKYFSDNFFNANPEPFKEIENIRNLMKEMIKDYNSRYFENMWNDWYKERFAGTDFGVSTEEKKDKVIMKIQIPGLESNNVNININDKRIKIDGSYNKINEVRDEKNNIVSKSQEYKSFSKIMSLPANAKSDNAQIKTEKDLITITFQKNTKTK